MTWESPWVVLRDRRGVTGPHDFVSRAQMATFLARAFDLQSGSQAGFVDVSGNVHAPQIGALAASGITVGCAAGPPRRYCPDDFVSRAQMATFLKRARTTFIGPCPEPESQEGSGNTGGGSGGGSVTGPGSGGPGFWWPWFWWPWFWWPWFWWPAGTSTASPVPTSAGRARVDSGRSRGSKPDGELASAPW